MAGANLWIVNNTGENIRVAIFKKSFRKVSLNSIAWKIVSPPQKGHSKVPVPSTYEVFVNYPGPGDDCGDPEAGNQTQKITLGGFTGRFIVSSEKTLDGKGVVANIAQSFQGLVPEEVHIVNQAGFGVWGHITKGCKDIFAPRRISPGSELIEDLRADYYIAIIEEFVKQGDELLEEEITAPAPRAIRADQTATVSGSMCEGYGIKVEEGAPPC